MMDIKRPSVVGVARKCGYTVSIEKIATPTKQCLTTRQCDISVYRPFIIKTTHDEDHSPCPSASHRLFCQPARRGWHGLPADVCRLPSTANLLTAAHI